MAKNVLYSVVQSKAPYTEHILVGHRLEYPEAKALMDSLKTGVISMAPSSDYADDAAVGDMVSE